MLTAKQGKFIELFAAGTSQSLAYRGAYDTQNMSDKTVWQKVQGSGDTLRSAQGLLS